MNPVWLSALCAGLTLVSLPVMRFLADRWKLSRPNFKGKNIPAGFGFMLVLSAVPVYVLLIALTRSRVQTAAYLTAVVGFGIVGLLDDLFGNRDAGGFKGHLGLLKKGKISTGLLKAGIGGLIGLALGFMISGFDPFLGLVDALVICLSANFLNLLDLRPGRAVSCFWVGIIFVAFSTIGRLPVWREVIPVVVPAACLTALDRSALVMMGDAGSNVLGAVLGLTIAYGVGLTGKAVFLLFVIAVHLYAEKYSVSRLIESNRVLKRIDRLLGER